MTPPLTRAERRHVDLYEDWCAVAGVQPYPAAWDTVEAFLDAAGGAPSTQRARAAAIRAAHRAAGLDGPAPRAPGDAMASPRPAVDHLVRALPQWGWPAALFARRDALLLTLWAGTHLSVLDLAALTPADLAVPAPGRLTVRGDAMASPDDDDPAACPACVWLRWRPIHHRIARWSPARDLRRLLGVRPDDAPRVDLEHRCTRTPPALPEQTGRTALFPSLNQWGHAQIPVDAATPRGLRGVVAAHRDGHAKLRLATVLPPDAPPAGSPPPPPPPALDPTTYQRGVKARQHAVTDLDGALARLEALMDQTGADLDSRFAALLDDGQEAVDRLTELTRLRPRRASRAPSVP